MPRKKNEEMTVDTETVGDPIEADFIDDTDPTELDQAIADAADENSDTDTPVNDPPRLEEEWTHETCKVEFTEQELSEMSGDMARKIGELREKEDAQKAVAAQMKAEIKTLSGEVEQLAVKVRNKFEYKQVPCDVVRNYTTKEITYIRRDTGEVHRQRTMRADEAQTEMDIG